MDVDKPGDVARNNEAAPAAPAGANGSAADNVRARSDERAGTFDMSLDSIINPIPRASSERTQASSLRRQHTAPAPRAADNQSSLAALALFSLSHSSSAPNLLVRSRSDDAPANATLAAATTAAAPTPLSRSTPRIRPRVANPIRLTSADQHLFKQPRRAHQRTIVSPRRHSRLPPVDGAPSFSSMSNSHTAFSLLVSPMRYPNTTQILSSERAESIARNLRSVSCEQPAIRRMLRKSPLRRSPRVRTPAATYGDYDMYSPSSSDEKTNSPMMSTDDLRGSNRSGAFWELAKEPKPKQRKSYRSENRYLSPNPFVIRYRRLTNLSAVHKNGALASAHATALAMRTPQSGYAHVLLVDIDGRVLPADTQKELVGGSRRVLILTDTSAQVTFSLKMHTTSRGEQYRLAFDIEWVGADGMEYRERVTSHAFRVDTNIRRQKRDTSNTDNQ